MGVYIEKLDKGFVNARPPLTLLPGEFQDGTNLSYVPNNQALVRAQSTESPAGPVWGSASTATNSIRGIRTLSFLNGRQVFLAAVDAALGVYTYRTSPTSAVSWSTLASSITSATTLDVATYNDRHYVFNGAHFNQCVYLNGSTLSIRRQGMATNLNPPSVSLVTSATQGFGGATGTYEYWYTEVARIQEGTTFFEIESDFIGTPAAVTITTTAQIPVITRDTFLNTNVDRWRIYRGFRAVSAQTAFPIGVKVGEVGSAVTSFINGTSQILGPFRPVASTQLGPINWTNLAGITAGTQGDGNAANIALTGINSGTVRLSYGTLAGLTPPISGLMVFVRNKRVAGNGVGGVSVYLSGDNNVTRTSKRGVAFSAGNGYLATSSQYNIGGPGDFWGKDPTYWDSTTLGSANFRLSLEGLVGFAQSATWDVDDVELNIVQQGLEIVQGPFPAYSVSIDGNTTQGSLLGSPPISSTGDIFENSVVVNDVTKPSIFRYSTANQPEYFPDLYFGRLDGSKGEAITCIRTVGNRVVIATRSTIWRVNYLPRFQDSQFDRGRPLDLISSDLGIATPKAACLYTSQTDGRPMLAFFNDKGLFATDGFTIQQLSADLDWAALTSSPISGATNAFLVNNEAQFTLSCFYASAAQTAAGQRLDFCYHPSHLKEGGVFKSSARLRISVPGRWADSAAYANRPNDTPLVAVGTVSGYVDILGSTLYGDYTVKTRRFYPGGFGNESRIRSIYVTRFDENKVDSGVASVGASASYTNKADFTTSASITIPSGCRDNARWDVNLMGEQVQFNIAYTPNAPAATDGIVAFGLRGDDFGDEDSSGLP